jgi:NAD(P)-dependent dehydrogenase (short-subunit alcohol dehydrogenase family)
MAIFTNQVVVVTGASEGIGRAFCLGLAPQRCRLVLAARSRERLDSLAREVEAQGSEALVVPTDVTSEAACERLVEAAVDHWGQLDVLVCNAGGTMWTLLSDLQDTSVFERLMKLNYLGSAWCTYYALPHLRQSRGRIVGVSSVAGLTGVPTRTAYAASKHAMFGFFDSLRVELRSTGVTVTMIAPDFVVSEIHRRALGPGGEPLGESPIQEGKVMTADECARLMIKAVERRERLLIPSLRGKLGRWVKMLSPDLVDRISARAIQQKR